ncbi:MAG: nicotinamide-nucleotide amidohydrolase family protein [Candidatus Hydrogenedentes bacterium]|nr:nicotinamide-nucleotide amidohydrolase family protein [Candidatus Hydrogenedentota bacterium]
MTLESIAGELLNTLGHTLATAESCTGGLVAHRITNVPGASMFFLGSVIAYNNGVKQALLGVSHESLLTQGAVSEAVALEMASGARTRLRSDWAVGITGIAGPGGGTLDKPVGLVYISVAGPAGATVSRCVFDGNREEIKGRTADAALSLLINTLKAFEIEHMKRDGS